jgi:hypothetical protein
MTTGAVLSALAALAATVVPGLLYLARLRMRIRAELERWQAAQRLADRHGPQILTDLHQLAPALREPDEAFPPLRLPRQRRPRARRQKRR